MTPAPDTTYTVTDGSLREFSHDAKNRIATIALTAEVLRHRLSTQDDLLVLIDRIDRQASQLNEEITGFSQGLRAQSANEERAL